MYRDYCKILHAKDKFVFFHADGNISDIFGDLVKLEIDAIHSQLGLMNVERLAKRHRGRVTFWAEEIAGNSAIRAPPRSSARRCWRSADCSISATAA